MGEACWHLHVVGVSVDCAFMQEQSVGGCFAFLILCVGCVAHMLSAENIMLVSLFMKFPMSSSMNGEYQSSLGAGGG